LICRRASLVEAARPARRQRLGEFALLKGSACRLKMIALTRGANIVRRELGLREAHIPATEAKLSMLPLAGG
jgi:hypothetical protein